MKHRQKENSSIFYVTVTIYSQLLKQVCNIDNIFIDREQNETYCEECLYIITIKFIVTDVEGKFIFSKIYLGYNFKRLTTTLQNPR